MYVNLDTKRLEIVDTDRSLKIEQGLDLIPRLGEVMPDVAGSETNLIYESVKQRLRVPFVNFVFRVLANYPAYLAMAWEALEPHLLTAEFERAADELRDMALLQTPQERVGLDLDKLGAQEQVRVFTETIHYVLPKLLLVATTLDEGLASEQNASTEPPKKAVAPGVAAGTTGLQMVSQDAPDKVQRIFDEIRQRHDHPGVASYYRGIAWWPRFLEAAWEQVEPVVGSASYEERRQALLDRAYTLSRALPLIGRDSAKAVGCDGRCIEEIRSILAVFRFRVISDTFVEVALIKALLDDEQTDHISPFSFTQS